MSIHTPTKLISTIEASRAARPSAPVAVMASAPADQFSLQRMAQLGQRLPDNAIEVKESKALAQITGIGERRLGELVALSRIAKAAKRDLSAGVPTSGGDLIQSDLTDGIVSALYPHSVVVKLGAQVWPNARGNFVSPVLSTATTGLVASGENATVTPDTSADFNALELQPIRLSTELHVSRQFVIQAKDRSLEQFLANEILKSLGALMDRVVLNGSTGGTATAPDLVNNTNLPSITFGGAPTWLKILAARYAVNNANFPNDKRGWVVSPNAAQVFAATPKVAGYPSFLANLDLGQIAGDRFEETTNLAGKEVNKGQVKLGSDHLESIWIVKMADLSPRPPTLDYRSLFRWCVRSVISSCPLHSIRTGSRFNIGTGSVFRCASDFRLNVSNVIPSRPLYSARTRSRSNIGTGSVFRGVSDFRLYGRNVIASRPLYPTCAGRNSGIRRTSSICCRPSDAGAGTEQNGR